MDVIILIAVIVLFVFLFKRTFSSFVYAVAVTDIFFRIVTYLKIRLTSGSLYSFLDRYIPSNIPAVIEKYTNYEFSIVPASTLMDPSAFVSKQSNMYA